MTTREILGICFCPTCAVDTMPDAKTGHCFFCNTKLTSGHHGARVAGVAFCEECEALIEAPHSTQRFCSYSCRQKTWRRTEVGRAWDKEKRRRAGERKRYLRSLSTAMTTDRQPQVLDGHGAAGQKRTVAQ